MRFVCKGLYVKAVTRSGRTVLEEDSKFVSYGVGDVTKPDSLKNALAGASGVIFAASASKNGGDAAHVDYLVSLFQFKVFIFSKCSHFQLLLLFISS